MSLPPSEGITPASCEVCWTRGNECECMWGGLLSSAQSHSFLIDRRTTTVSDTYSATMPRVHLSKRKRTADASHNKAAQASDKTGVDTEDTKDYQVRERRAVRAPPRTSHLRGRE
jgi:hypothetical protein